MPPYLALAKVDAARQLANDEKIDVLQALWGCGGRVEGFGHCAGESVRGWAGGRLQAKAQQRERAPKGERRKRTSGRSGEMRSLSFCDVMTQGRMLAKRPIWKTLDEGGWEKHRRCVGGDGGMQGAAAARLGAEKRACVRATRCPHLLANLEEALLGADVAARPLGAADGAENHGVRRLAGSEGVVRQGRSMAGGTGGGSKGRREEEGGHIGKAFLRRVWEAAFLFWRGGRSTRGSVCDMYVCEWMRRLSHLSMEMPPKSFSVSSSVYPACSSVALSTRTAAEVTWAQDVCV